MVLRQHIAIEDWVDVVRGLAPEGLRREADAHLEGGCVHCRQTLSLLEQVARMAAREAAEAMPRDVEYAAKGLFLRHRPERLRRLPRLLAKLVLGAHPTPAVAGVRGLQRFTHQGLYEAGKYSVDLRLDLDYLNARGVLVGQVADRTEPTRKLAGAPVVLLSGREVVAQASSNEFGEFQVEYEPRERLRLCVALEEGRIEVPLKALPPGEAPGRRSARLKPFRRRRRS